MYFDNEAICRDGQLVRFWLLLDYPAPMSLSEGKQYRSSRHFVEVNCDRDTHRHLKAAFSEGPMADGRIVDEVGSTPEEPTMPNTLQWELTRGMCLRTSPAPVRK